MNLFKELLFVAQLALRFGLILVVLAFFMALPMVVVAMSVFYLLFIR